MKIKFSHVEQYVAGRAPGGVCTLSFAETEALLRLARAAKAEDTQRTKILAGELKFPRDTEQCDAVLRELYEALEAFDFTNPPAHEPASALRPR